MRVLFCMGEKSADGRVFVRPSARCIAIEGDRVAMVHSLQYDYYKFPGGRHRAAGNPRAGAGAGNAGGSGSVGDTRSIREFGLQFGGLEASDGAEYDCFVQDNFYYLCRVERTTVEQRLDDYEAQERLRWNGCSQSGQSK